MAKVAVIGCTHAGVFATTSILAAHPDWEVHVFERNDTVSFLSCGIALWVGDHVSDPNKMFYSSPAALEQVGAHVHMMSDVTSADVRTKHVAWTDLRTGESHEDDFDYLVVTTGSKPIVPPLPGIDGPRVLQCKNWADGKRIHDAIGNAASAVIIGAGYIGAELAALLKASGARNLPFLPAFPQIGRTTKKGVHYIDGVPVNNTSQGEISGGAFSSQPGSEGIADINPENIESISVLSGPAAAALYGSAAAQGVIMITTKKGKEGKVSVTVSNSTQFANPFVMPEFQNSYINRAGEVKSWGAKTPSAYGNYDPKDFFNTGTNVQNNVSLTAGTDKNQTYISLGTTNARGIIPNNKYDRYNFAFRNTTTFLNDRMTLDFSFNYIKEHDTNLTAQGQYFNPLTAVYLFPRGESFDAIRTFEIYDESRGINVQNWNFGDALSMQNPYWVAKRMVRSNNRSRYMVSASLKYKIFDWMDVVGRLRWDDANTKQEDKRHASTTNLFAHSKYGFYGYDKVNDRSLYGDLMFNINKTLDDFSVSANLGGSFSRIKYNVTGFQGGLKAPSNLFTPNAIDYGTATADNRPIYTDNAHKINSLFANVELGWRSMLFMTLTGRNDWDSALDGTDNVSFFYPSVGMSAVISQTQSRNPRCSWNWALFLFKYSSSTFGYPMQA